MTISRTSPSGVTLDLDTSQPDDDRFFIRLRNWERYQDWRYSKTTDRAKWVKLWPEILHSDDWVLNDSDTKVLMVTLMALAGQQGNRIRNHHRYLAHICGIPVEKFTDCWCELFANGNGGFFDLTLDPAPETKRDEDMAKPKRKTRAKPTGTSARFEEFWDVYPKSKDRKAALERWQKSDLDEHADAIIAAVKIQATSEEWTDRDGKFIPYAATYLNKERWKDEQTTVGRSPGDLPDNAPGERGY